MTTCRGIRGATCAEDNTRESIITATRHLLEQMTAANNLTADDLASILFSATPDLNAAFPACAARQIGWLHVPLLCMQEIDVPGSLPRCIRVLAMWNTDRSPEEIRHVYLGQARGLRPDLVLVEERDDDE